MFCTFIQHMNSSSRYSTIYRFRYSLANYVFLCDFSQILSIFFRLVSYFCYFFMYFLLFYV